MFNTHDPEFRMSARRAAARRLLGTAVLGATIAVALFAPPTATRGLADEPKMKIIGLTGPLFDPFFSALKLGFDDAAKTFDVDVQYTTLTKVDNLVNDFAHLLEQSISAHPAAISVGDFFPDALEPIIKKATDEGAVIVLHNSGLAHWKQLGVIGYVGEDATEMGRTAGELEAAAGVHHGLCVDQVPGNPVLEQRCNGFADGLKAKGGSSKMLTIPTADANNPTAVTQDIKGALQADKDIDGVLTLGSAIAMNAVQSISDSGRAGKITIGTTDLSNADLDAVKDGKLLFVIDQQPYLQGFDTVQIAVQYLRFGVHPIGPVITGPLLITKDNVDSVIKHNMDHKGIRGAM